MTVQQRPVVGISLGDAGGIGPEIVVKAHREGIEEFCTPLVVGDARIVAAAAAAVDTGLQIRSVAGPEEAAHAPGTIQVVDLADLDPADVEVGKPAAAAGGASVTAMHAVGRMALDGRIAAVASAPASKEAFNLAGHEQPGGTEVFAAQAGVEAFHTILVGGPLRVSLVTSHCSLADAIRRCTADRVARIAGELHTALQEVFRLPTPRIAVAGLNPHAGENGLLGREELDEVIPGIERAREAGIPMEGPFASDSLFLAAERGRYDAIVAMYHDQGAIPLKRYGYVTYAAGLPYVRTTCGHGTGYDIAGKGIADPELFVRAVRLAAELGATRTTA